MRVLVTGASGAIGKPLIAAPIRRGHTVTAIVRSTTGIESIASYGARALMTDVFDPAAVEEVTRNSQPGIVIDQLPSLPRTPADLPRPLPADRKLRLEGRGNRAG